MQRLSPAHLMTLAVAAFLIIPIIQIAPVATAADAVQVPGPVRQQVDDIQDHFESVLDEECPGAVCYAVGCKVSRFDTLDQTQNSSLPGLDDEAGPAAKPQYRLASVLCEFAYEPSVATEDLNRIKQRVKQKIQMVGTDIQLQARALQPKPTDPAQAKAAAVPPPLPEVPPTWQMALWQKLLPFLPWFASVVLAMIVVLALIWSLRRLGRERPKVVAGAGAGGSSALALTAAAPTPRMLLTRVDQLRGELAGDRRLVELTLKRHFENESYEELCLFLRSFGPELLAPFKEKGEYRDRLGVLSQHYSDKVFADDPSGTWEFLDRVDRDMTAAKVRIDSEPLEDEFNFLATVEVDEFVGILRELNEDEAIAAVAYAPRRLRERFFANANPAFTAKFVEHLTRVEKMPDAFVRHVAQRLRQVYTEKGESLRTIRVDKIPLLEEALNALEPEKRRMLLQSLGRDNPAFAKSLGPSVFLDDSLLLLPEGLVTEALLAVTPEEAGHYLAGFSWSQALLAKVSPRLVESIKPHLTANPAGGDKLARSGREKIGAFVKKLHAQGSIDLSKLNAKLIEGGAPP